MITELLVIIAAMLMFGLFMIMVVLFKILDIRKDIAKTHCDLLQDSIDASKRQVLNLQALFDEIEKQLAK